MKRTQRTSKHTKVVKITYYECPNYSPAFDEEDIALEKIGDHSRLESLLLRGKPLNSFISKKQRSVMKDEQGYVIKIVSKILRVFFARVLEDIIKNDAIFLFPNNYVYLVAAQQSPNSEKFRYDYVHGQGQVSINLVYSRRGFKIAKGNKKFISVSNRFDKMLKEELDKGHIYNDIDTIMEKMQSYGY